jgi:hypothetical protein
VHRVDRVALAIDELDRHRVIGAEDEDAGIDKVEHGRVSGLQDLQDWNGILRILQT